MCRRKRSVRKLFFNWLMRQLSPYCQGHGDYFPHRSPCPYCGKRVKPEQIGKAKATGGCPSASA